MTVSLSRSVAGNLALLLFLSSSSGSASASHSSGVLYYCNRGFCYTKTEPLDPSRASTGNKRKSSRGGLNFCHDDGGHCELFDILGEETAGAEFEAVECTTDECLRMQQQALKEEEAESDSATTMLTSERDVVDELVDLDYEEARVSWRERPKRGRCYDSQLLYEFDCNLVEILDDGLVLIEDLRAGGVFAAQPKSQFSTRRHSSRHRRVPPTPKVMSGSGIADPNEDFRTNVSLNLEGI